MGATAEHSSPNIKTHLAILSSIHGGLEVEHGEQHGHFYDGGRDVATAHDLPGVLPSASDQRGRRDILGVIHKHGRERGGTERHKERSHGYLIFCSRENNDGGKDRSRGGWKGRGESRCRLPVTRMFTPTFVMVLGAFWFKTSSGWVYVAGYPCTQWIIGCFSTTCVPSCAGLPGSGRVRNSMRLNVNGRMKMTAN